MTADPGAVNAGADGFYDSGGFIAEAGGEAGLLKVLAAGVEGFGAVEADGLDADADFAGFGLTGRMVFKFEGRGAGELVETYNLGHGVLLGHWMVDEGAGCRGVRR